MRPALGVQCALSVLPSRGEVCPREAPESGAAIPPAAESGVGELGMRDEHVEYVAFTADSGSISKMAIVRRRLARVVGRYLLGEPIAAGGMATVHLGRLVGPAGFSRTVAVKRLHAHLAGDPEFVQRFVDEARIASRVRHGNVVQTLDVVSVDDELLLVLDYIHGESLARLRRLALAADERIPPHVAAGIVIGVLRGLHAAHEAKSAKGAALDLVHRDISPQNILVGADGVARVLDFGIAQAAGREAETLRREIKGKLAYMPPEQLSGDELDRRADLFAVGVVLWEALAGERLFRGEDTVSTMDAVYTRVPARLEERGIGVPAAVDDVLARALAKEASGRYDTADAMARALEAALAPASDREVAEWVERVASDVLAARVARVADFEGDDTGRSMARLYAARPSEEATARREGRGSRRGPNRDSRRDALVPPPLESVTNERATPMRGRVATVPTLEMEAARAAAQDGVVGFTPSMPMEGVSGLRPVHTPLVMTSSTSAEGHGQPSSGKTRIEPIEGRRPRQATPVPMPMLMPAAAAMAKRRGPSVFQLALLVVFPPLIVAIALTGGRSGSVASGSGGNAPTEANAETLPATAVTAPAAGTAALAATAVPTTPPVIGAAPSLAPEPSPAAATTTTADAGAHAAPRQERKNPRAVPHRKIARPVPVAVNR